MTDESDYEQSGKKVKVTHKPDWRSNLLERMIGKLDKRLAAKESAKSDIGFKRRERIAGLLSTSQAPSTAPAWAVNVQDVSNPDASTPVLQANQRSSKPRNLHLSDIIR